MKSLCVLGRQPAISFAELESLFGPGPITKIAPDLAVVDIDPTALPFDRLGGVIKLATILVELTTTKIDEIEKYLSNAIPHHLQFAPEGKFTLGLSWHGFDLTPIKINALGLRLKKSAVKSGRSTRIIPNKEPQLSSAQVLHNNLTGLKSWELIIVKNDGRTILAQTKFVQDIEAYAARDRARPQRDAKVGILPPKLAQIIVNLGADGLTPDNHWILDPFCGGGGLLQEAALMGFNVIGSDIEKRMVESSAANLEWLRGLFPSISFEQKLMVADAAKNEWPVFDVLASELTLGEALFKAPDPLKLARLVSNCDQILKSTLQNLGGQLNPNQRLCLAVPAWPVDKQFQHLPTLDHLEEFGYNRVSFIHAQTSELIYLRSGQFVARELVVLQRI